MENINIIKPEDLQGASGEFIESLKEVSIDKENITCSICLEEFKKGEKCIELPCKDNCHYFHKGNDNCPGIIEWLQKSNTCPLCRTEFPKERMAQINLPQLLNFIHDINIIRIMQVNEEEIMNRVLEYSLHDQ